MSNSVSTPRFTLTNLPIPGLMSVCRQRAVDARGNLSRLFCAEELQAAGWHGPVAQINHTQTRMAGTVRGMHYQNAPHAEAKLVTCLRGHVWDVAVDLRPTSPTFLKWCSLELSASNEMAILIPPGCAHGFQTLTDDVDILYVHSHPYTPEADAGLNPSDPRIAIEWPIAISLISNKDANHPMLTPDFAGVTP